MKQEDLVKIAKRENNTKRGYLVVNPLQGKHIPVSPTKALELFSQISDKLKHFDRESTLIIGFAETATAIGAYVAIELRMDYVQTTRENLEEADYLFFEESHSHATEQKLVKSTIESEKYKQIIFIEDEVTTGNTILNLINAIERPISYSVASLLNGMGAEALAKFENKGIQVYYIAKTDHSGYTEIANGYRGDGCYHEAETGNTTTIEQIEMKCKVEPRKLTTGRDYKAACEHLWETVKGKVKPNKSTLVLGTEEFMYPALYVAREIEGQGKTTVQCHSTTRSPIVVSSEKEYPLHERWSLTSLYEEDRRTFIYDLDKYDQVFILTDAEKPTQKAVASLVNALRSVGNDDITLVRWCRK